MEDDDEVPHFLEWSDDEDPSLLDLFAGVEDRTLLEILGGGPVERAEVLDVAPKHAPPKLDVITGFDDPDPIRKVGTLLDEKGLSLGKTALLELYRGDIARDIRYGEPTFMGSLTADREVRKSKSRLIRSFEGFSLAGVETYDTLDYATLTFAPPFAGSKKRLTIFAKLIKKADMDDRALATWAMLNPRNWWSAIKMPQFPVIELGRKYSVARQLFWKSHYINVRPFKNLIVFIDDEERQNLRLPAEIAAIAVTTPHLDSRAIYQAEVGKTSRKMFEGKVKKAPETAGLPFTAVRTPMSDYYLGWKIGKGGPLDAEKYEHNVEEAIRARDFGTPEGRREITFLLVQILATIHRLHTKAGLIFGRIDPKDVGVYTFRERDWSGDVKLTYKIDDMQSFVFMMHNGSQIALLDPTRSPVYYDEFAKDVIDVDHGMMRVQGFVMTEEDIEEFKYGLLGRKLLRILIDGKEDSPWLSGLLHAIVTTLMGLPVSSKVPITVDNAIKYLRPDQEREKMTNFWWMHPHFASVR